MRLLVKRISHSRPGSDKGTYKRGDVVVITEDGLSFGNNLEDANGVIDEQFSIMELPGVPKADFAHLSGMRMIQEGEDMVMLLRRDWQVNFGLLTASERVTFDGPGRRKGTVTRGRLIALTRVKP